MGLFFIYSLKVALCLIAFYLVYKLLLSKETFHAFNRLVLLSVIVISIAIPWLKLTTAEPTTLNQGVVSLESLIASAEIAEDETSSGPTMIQVFFLIYIIGVVVFFVREVFSVARLMHIMRGKTISLSSSQEQLGLENANVRLVVMKGETAPFSWFRYVVISEKDLRENPREILTHELAHIRLGHSWDIALSNVLIIFQWWNPAAWLLKREMQNVHEFEADEAVIKRGVDAKQYQLLLIRKSVGERLFSMANNLNHHSLKKRITMMTTKKSSPWQKVKALAVLPMAAIAVVAFANPEVERVAEQVETQSDAMAEIAKADINGGVAVVKAQNEEQTETAESKGQPVVVKGDVVSKEDHTPIVGVVVQIRGSKTGTVTDEQGCFHLKDVPVGSWIDVFMIDRETGSLQVTQANASDLHFSIGYDKPTSSKSPEDNAFDVVEQMPQFPGGAAAMMHWLATNIKYPKDAEKARQEGRVIAQFVVEKDGSITDVHIVKSISASLDEEAIRVLNTMPKWTPGKQNGEPVRVKYTIPLSFKLTGSESGQADKGNTTTDTNAYQEVNKAAKEKELSLKVKDMLLVVDGNEVPESEISKYCSPNQIQSITVNKDINQIKAKYGAAANGKKGVIMVVTKK